MADQRSKIPPGAVHQDAAIVFIDLSGFYVAQRTFGMDSALEMLKDFHA